MNKLILNLSDRIEGYLETNFFEDFIVLNKSFIIEHLLINDEPIKYSVVINRNYQIISFVHRKGILKVKYSGILDGTTGGYPYVKEKTTDSFYILRNETFYYPILVKPNTKEFMDMILCPEEKDEYQLTININDDRSFVTNLTRIDETTYRSFNPTIVVGYYKIAQAYFGSIYHLNLEDKHIINTINLISEVNNHLLKYKEAKVKDFNIIIIPGGYGSFVLPNSMFITAESLLSSKGLIHELIHTNWNPRCDYKTQKARFFDEAFTQFLTLRVLDELKIQNREETKHQYINEYKAFINDYGYTPHPILEYSKNQLGDLSYSFGALAILAIEEEIGINKMDSILKTILSKDIIFNFDIFKDFFEGIDDIWNDYFITNNASNKVLFDK